MAEARTQAAEARRSARGGADPVAERTARREKARTAGERAFRVVARDCLEHRADQWRNPKHRDQWWASLEAHAFPRLGDKPLEAVGRDDVLAVLEPIWREIPGTAARVRQRIEAVLAYAAARSLRPANEVNPAAWHRHLGEVLPPARRMKARKRERTGRGEHHPSLPWREVPAFMAALGRHEGVAAAALAFAVLTAARSGEARGMPWGSCSRGGASGRSRPSA